MRRRTQHVSPPLIEGGGEQVPRLRDGFGKPFCLILVGEVGGCHTLPVLTQVLVPRRHHEDLFEFTGSLTVAEPPPLGGFGS